LKTGTSIIVILSLFISCAILSFSGCASSVSRKEDVNTIPQNDENFIKADTANSSSQEQINWLTYNFDNQRQGVSKSKLTFPLKLSWKRKISSKIIQFGASNITQFSSPVVVDNFVYLGSDNNFLALDSKKNTVLWETPVDGMVESSPTFYNGKVYFGTDKGVLYALNATDGGVNWTYHATSPIHSSPLIEQDSVFFNTLDSKVYALDINSGEKIWQYIRRTPKKTWKAFTSPSLSEGKLFIGFSDGSLVALNAYNGTKLLDVQVGNNNKTPFVAPLQPVIVDGLIYIMTPETKLLVLDEYGKKLWSFDTTKVSQFIVTKNKVFLLNLKGEVFAINKITGENIWKVKVTKGTPTHAIIAGDDLIVSTKFISTILDLEILSSDGGYVEAINTETGNKKWSYKADSGVSTSPVVANNKLFFVSDKGYLHMFEPS
jgi:outer membrane protein assembly factor BamB